MNTNQRKFSRTALSLCIAALFSPVALAAEATIETEQAPKNVERIAVTGSNIFKGSANVSSSAPITEVGKEMIEGVAAISIGDVLNNIPSVTSAINGSSDNVSLGGAGSNVGVSTTSLRNLGSARTLVLVNGRRYVSGVSANTGYGVDLNSIPTAIIERVDVLTGGQSAIYGSDAIAGVINIITKRNFDGAEINAFAADSSDGGAERQNIDFTYGKNFDSGNAWVSAGYANQEVLNSSARDFSRYEMRFVDTNGDGIRDTIARRDGPGHVDGALLGYGDLKIFGNGDPFNANQPLLDSNYQPTSDSDWDNQHSNRTLVLPYQRFNIASGISFDLSDKSSLEVELNYAQTQASVNLEEAPIDVVNDVFRKNKGGTTGIDVASSPYFVGSSAGQQLLAAMGSNTSLDGVTTNRRTFEFGNRITENQRDTFRVAGNYTYYLDNGMDWKTGATYGITSQTQQNSGDFSIPNMQQALTIEEDGNGGYQCADVIARTYGCVPVNPFGTTDSLVGQAGITGFSDEAMKYLAVNTGQTGKVEQFVVNSVVSGELDFSLGHDNLGFAAGVEYRKESAVENPDSFRQLGITREGPVQPIDGSFDVAEVFGELYVPVADWLNLSLAARFGDYSTIGTTSTYRLGIDAPIHEMFRIRASQSSSVRAPNINDIFSTGTTSVANPTIDVCNGTSNNGTTNTDRNCTSISAISNRMDTDANGQYILVGSETNNTLVSKSGSPDLKAETADSLTLGFVLTPLDNLSVSVDYYGIEIEDGITTITPDTMVKRCYDVDPSQFDPTCGGRVLRDVQDGPILNIYSTSINANTISTSGVDLELAYYLDNLTVNFIANYLAEYEIDTLSGPIDNLGTTLFPEYRYTINASYDITEDFNLFAQMTYRAETEGVLGETTLSNDLNTMDAVYYADVRASYQINDALNVYIGSNNLFDQQPDIQATSAAVGTNTTPQAYDVIGRQLFAGVKMKF
ncbi:TonB-dependent receptor domain-containing protein [Shewanella sp. OMA3-2]|uniref:TonB-dependent receptor domain-containing protein n=1 Tax=Shewanella sp. OMA3-2 TaxID=2908650 RepID=UPI001F18CA20|nr:TonB-dependent receptor [Shewanella sp. OMA3-2]UJF22923.1 TonB-dependent receptor [Shewanella sp. OMA3-2]